MRKRLIVSISAVVILLASTLIFLSEKSYKKGSAAGTADQPIEVGKEIDEQEEVKERMEHEIAMTRDPLLGYVPKERLVLAEEQAKQIMLSQRSSPLALMTWTERGPNNIGGRSRGVLVDVNDATNNTVLVGSVSGGLWRTTNFKAGAPTWTRLTTVSANLAITSIAQDPSNPNTMYAGTGEGFFNFDNVRGLGVYKSIDGGLTWSLIPSTTTGGTNVTDFTYVNDIAVYSNGHVYVSAISTVFCNRGGILKSTNGGTNWTTVIGQLVGGTCATALNFRGYDIEISASGDIYATTQDASGSDTAIGRIWRSDAGVNVGNVGTWTDISPDPLENEFWLRVELACAPSNNNRVYAILQGTTNAIDTMLRSDDRGATWININNTATLWCDQGTSTSTDFSRNQAWYDLIMAVKPDNQDIVFAGGVDLMTSTDAGGVWTQATQWANGCGGIPSIHADNHNIVYLPGAPNEFIALNDGGIYYTTNNGTSFTNKNTGYNTVQYYSGAIHPTSGSNYALGGSQDNGSHILNSAGIGAGTTATGGDGGFCFIDQDDPTYQITSFTGSQYSISRNSGANFNVGAFFAGGRFINPTEYDNTANLIYCAAVGRNIRRIQNITAGMIQAFSIPASSNASVMISALKVDPNTANRVWFAYQGSGQAPMIYYLDDAHTATSTNPDTVRVSAPAIPNSSYISSIDIENGDASHLMLTVSNYGVNSVWESIDMGASWQSIEGNLPDMPIRWGVFVPAGWDPGNAPNAIGGVVLATELGVWSTQTLAGGSTVWIQNSTGLGNVRTDMIKLRDSDKSILAATHGRGMFTAALFSLPVTFVGFDGQAEKLQNKLWWDVENEQNNKGFEIERKQPGEAAFKRIGFVAGKENSVSRTRYSFVDKDVDLGKNHAIYRLRQVDYDNRATYSKMVTLNRQISTKFIEYISVEGNQMFIRVNKQRPGNMNLLVINGSGQTVIKRQVSIQNQLVDLTGISTGVYTVQLSDGTQSFTGRIVKSK